MKQIIIFGAGDYGKLAYDHFGSQNIAGFIDNNPDKIGMTYLEKPVMSLEMFMEDSPHQYRLVIAVRSFSGIVKQLKEKNIKEYDIYSPQYQDSLDRLEKIIKESKNITSLVFLGVDDSTNILVEEVLAKIFRLNKYKIYDCRGHNTIGTLVGDVVVEEIPDAIFDEYVVISANDRYRELEAIAEHIVVDKKKIINPFAQEGYFPRERLIFNPYEHDTLNKQKTEDQWNQETKKNQDIDTVYKLSEVLNKYQPLFNHVEIETINRCNGKCSFCPVSVKHDIRKKMIMSDELFKKIIDDLAELKYDGKIALFSNGEPMLDPNIIDRHAYMRKKLPLARTHLFTNGTLLTLDKFIKLISYLDELIIDNYNQKLELNDTSKEILAYCDKNKDLIDKVTIVLRKEDEVLTSRGGDAPNRKDKIEFIKERCVLPFRQLIIRPDGKVSLCCNDPYGRITLGDFSKQTAKEIWYGTKFAEIRKKIMQGRGYIEHCKYCDTFYF